MDTYFINVSGYFSGEFNYGMDNYGNIEVMFSMREYKVGSGVGNDVSGSSTRLLQITENNRDELWEYI